MGRVTRAALLLLALAAFFRGGQAARVYPAMPPCLPEAVLYSPLSLLYLPVLFVVVDAVWQGVNRRVFSPEDRSGFWMGAFRIGGSVLFTLGAGLYLIAYQDHCYCGGLLGLPPEVDCLDAGNNFARNFEVLVAWAALAVSRLVWEIQDAMARDRARRSVEQEPR